MKKLIYFLPLIILIATCKQNINSVEIDFTLPLKGGNKDIFGVFTPLKIINNDVFIINTLSKKILHLVIKDKEVVLTDSFYYGNIWITALDNSFSTDTNQLKIDKLFYQAMGNQSICNCR